MNVKASGWLGIYRVCVLNFMLSISTYIIILYKRNFKILIYLLFINWIDYYSSGDVYKCMTWIFKVNKQILFCYF